MRSSISIGRSSQCDIVVSGGRVSRVHAELSVVNGQYVYHDMSSNGSNIGGRMICNEKVVIAPGTQVIMANEIPLPWDRIYQLLPPNRQANYNNAQTLRHAESATVYGAPSVNYHESLDDHESSYVKDELGIGWGILSFIIPLIGLILYFAWKEKTPHRANQAGVAALIGFGINLIIFVL